MRYQFDAFLKDPDADRPENPIHSTASARDHGFRGALVGGIHIYGWTCGAFLQSLGNTWLDQGWVEVAFRKPVYDGDRMTVNINGENFTATNAGSDVCLEGRVGSGEAPFLSDITTTGWQAPCPAVTDRPRLTMDIAPRKGGLVPMALNLGDADHEEFIRDTLRDDNPLFHGSGAHCHPSWIAGRLIYLLHHSFEYGPAIHTNSQIQHLAPAHVGQTFTVTGFCHDVFERNGHHFIVNDGSIWNEAKTEVTRLRHTAIFKLRTA